MLATNENAPRQRGVSSDRNNEAFLLHVEPPVLTALDELREDFFDRADDVGLQAELIRRCGESFVDLEAIDRMGIAMALAEIRMFAGRRFDFADCPEEGTTCAACVIEVLDRDAETVDLCAWPLGRPSEFALALGTGEALGGDQIANPATYFLDRKLAVWRTPLRWLQARGEGVCIVNPRRTIQLLSDALGGIEGEDLRHARELARLLEGVFDRAEIYAPRRT